MQAKAYVINLVNAWCQAGLGKSKAKTPTLQLFSTNLGRVDECEAYAPAQGYLTPSCATSPPSMLGACSRPGCPSLSSPRT